MPCLYPDRIYQKRRSKSRIHHWRAQQTNQLGLLACENYIQRVNDYLTDPTFKWVPLFLLLGEEEFPVQNEIIVVSESPEDCPGCFVTSSLNKKPI